eukprot:4394415-Prymnesium_polylepis.1
MEVMPLARALRLRGAASPCAASHTEHLPAEAQRGEAQQQSEAQRDEAQRGEALKLLALWEALEELHAQARFWRVERARAAQPRRAALRRAARVVVAGARLQRPSSCVVAHKVDDTAPTAPARSNSGGGVAVQAWCVSQPSDVGRAARASSTALRGALMQRNSDEFERAHPALLETPRTRMVAWV